MLTIRVSRGIRVEIDPGFGLLDLVVVESPFQQIEQSSNVVNRHTSGPDARTTARRRLGILSVND